jgi:hypothetical protein
MDKSYSVSGVNEKGGRLRGGSFKITEKRGNGYVLANFAESTTMMRDLSVELYTSREDKRPLRGPAAEIEIPRSRSGSNVDMDEKELLATAIASFAHNYLSTKAG